ncbi:MAG: hypothetical protein QXP81_09470 [Nitrososphaerota archaeon]
MPEPEGDPVLRTYAYPTNLQHLVETLLFLVGVSAIAANLALPEEIGRGPPAVVAFLLSMLAAGLLSLLGYIHLKYRRAWQRKAIELYRNGIKVGRRFVPFSELRKIRTWEPRLEQLESYFIYRVLGRGSPEAEYSWRTKRTVRVQLELADGRKIGFRLKGKAFESFLTALYSVAEGSSFLPDERPLSVYGIQLFRPELERAAELVRNTAERSPSAPAPGRVLYKTKSEPTTVQREVEWTLGGFGVVLAGFGMLYVADGIIRWSTWRVMEFPDLTLPLAMLSAGIACLAAAVRLGVIGAWHRKPLEVRTDGLRIGKRFLGWHEISEIGYLESVEPEFVNSFDDPLLVHRIVTVRIRTLDGEAITLRLRDFHVFLRALVEATGTRFLPKR